MREGDPVQIRDTRWGLGSDQWLLWSLLALTLILGVVARFQGLGFRPLAEDEYYFLVSVESIFRSGLPEQAGGGYYVRGLPLQYLTALSRAIFEDPEFGLRLPTVLLSLIAVPVAFLYGKRLDGAYLGAGLAIAMLVSSWTVEFSRFGRMYGAFQLLTLLVLLSLHSVLTDRASPRTRYLPLLWGTLCALTHELGFFLLPLLALPVIVPGARNRFGSWAGVARYASATGAVYVALLAYHVFPFRKLSVQGALPEGMSADLVETPGFFRLPNFPFWGIADSPLLSLATVLAVVAAVGLTVHRATRDRGSIRIPLAVASMALAAAIFHQIAVAVGLVLVALGRYRAYLSSGHRPTVVVLFLTGLVSIGWLVLGGASRIAPALLPEFLLERLTEHRLSTIFFGWPEIYAPVVEPWFQEMPILAGLLAVGVLYRFWTRLDRPWREIAIDPSTMVVYVVVLMGIFSSYFHSTRYTYFVYPLALACLYLTLRALVKKLFSTIGEDGMRRYEATAALLVFLGVFAISEDFDPRHLLATGGVEVAFQTDRFERMRDTWYWRDDSQLPGQFVTSQASPRDPVIVMDLPAASYYIDRPHAVYHPRGLLRFYEVSREAGTVEFWSGMPLLSTPEELGAFVEGAPRAWIVRRTDAPRPTVISEAFGHRPHTLDQAFVGRDGRVEVVRIKFEK
jgi:hypothetical protein